MLHLQKTIFVFSDVRKTIDDFKKVLKNFESRVEFTEDLQKMSDVGICFILLHFLMCCQSKLLVSHCFQTRFLGCLTALMVIC